MNHLNEQVQKLLTNQRQSEAFSSSGHCVVQAGPGSGKTATLTLKIMKVLTENPSPFTGLACLTFNNEAVLEFKRRLRLLGMPTRPNIFLGTVHSFCLSAVIKPFIYLYRDNIPKEIKVAPSAVQNNLKEHVYSELGFSENISAFKTRFDTYRRTVINRNHTEWKQKDEEIANAIELYEDLLHKQGFLDFDDLILFALELIENQPFVRKCLSARYQWFFVDEYQDLGYPLHRIVLSLLENTESKVFAVGDPDQSIYGFTGASPIYLEELSRREDIQTVQLNVNYRCGQKIIDSSETVLQPPTPRLYKSNRSSDEPGEITFILKRDGFESQIHNIVNNIFPKTKEAGYSLRNTAILYIDKNDGAVITQVLDTYGIEYSGSKDNRYQRSKITRWIEDLAYWCVVSSENDTIRFQELYEGWRWLLLNTGSISNDNSELILNQMFYRAVIELKNGNLPFTEWLLRLDESLQLQRHIAQLHTYPDEVEAYKSLQEACKSGCALVHCSVSEFAGFNVESNCVQLNTLHSSKGLEFDVVIIPGLEEGRMPSFGASNPESLKEARRTFYVALTRARHLVYLLYSGWYTNRFGKVYRNGPSSFLKELDQSISH